MTGATAALVHIMETFLVRERVRFHKTVSRTSNSVYYLMHGPRFPYRLRISDHAESQCREFGRSADFHVLCPDDLRTAQTAIEARIVRPLRRARAG